MNQNLGNKMEAQINRWKHKPKSYNKCLTRD